MQFFFIFVCILPVTTVCVSQDPPTYEESVRQSLQVLQSIEAPFDTRPPSVMPQIVISQPVNALPQYEEITHSTTSTHSHEDPPPADSD